VESHGDGRLSYLDVKARREHAADVIAEALSLADDLTRPTAVIFQPHALDGSALAMVVPMDTREACERWATLANDLPMADGHEPSTLVATVRDGADRAANSVAVGQSRTRDAGDAYARVDPRDHGRCPLCLSFVCDGWCDDD
jgi:hypothetical protein